MKNKHWTSDFLKGINLRLIQDRERKKYYFMKSSSLLMLSPPMTYILLQFLKIYRIFVFCFIYVLTVSDWAHQGPHPLPLVPACQKAPRPSPGPGPQEFLPRSKIMIHQESSLSSGVRVCADGCTSWIRYGLLTQPLFCASIGGRSTRGPGRPAERAEPLKLWSSRFRREVSDGPCHTARCDEATQ